MKNLLNDLDETTKALGIGVVSGLLNALLTNKGVRDSIITALCGGVCAALAAPYLHTLLAKYITDNPAGLFYPAVFFTGLLAKDTLYWILNNKRVWLRWLGLGKWVDNKGADGE